MFCETSAKKLVRRRGVKSRCKMQEFSDMQRGKSSWVEFLQFDVNLLDETQGWLLFNIVKTLVLGPQRTIAILLPFKLKGAMETIFAVCPN